MHTQCGVRSRSSAEAKRPGKIRRADSAGVMVKTVSRQHRDRLKRAGTEEPYIAAEIGRERQGQHAGRAVYQERSRSFENAVAVQVDHCDGAVPEQNAGGCQIFVGIGVAFSEIRIPQVSVHPVRALRQHHAADFDRRPEQGNQLGNQVNPEVVAQSAAFLCGKADAVSRYTVILADADHCGRHIADDPAIDIFPGALPGRAEEMVRFAAEHQALFLCNRKQLLRLGKLGCDDFFSPDVFARFKRAFDRLIVLSRRGEVDDQLDLRVVEDLLQSGRLNAVLRRFLFRTRAASGAAACQVDDLKASGEVFEENVADAAASDNGGFDRLNRIHTCILLRINLPDSAT